VWRVPQFPGPWVNVYLVEDVLVDAGARPDRRRIFKAIAGRDHARGEVIFFRDSDGVAICGDVIRNLSYATALAGIKEPPSIFTDDMAENRRSIRKLADLSPALILAGHGPEVRDMAKFERFVGRLPAD
jgi:glyoxylase-like metal-dependent hydrolase (beta-lactamase superfamily II)